MQFEVRDETLARLRAAAEKAGFADLEEYLLSLVGEEEAEGGTPDESYEKWKRKFDAFVARQTSHNPNFDDSREAIYGDR